MLHTLLGEISVERVMDKAAKERFDIIGEFKKAGMLE
jgi:hypothetical protein